MSYVPPEIPEADIQFRPVVLRKEFAAELEQMINAWTGRYPKFTRYDAINIMREMEVTLEREENRDRKVKKGGGDGVHGQYFWHEDRQQFILFSSVDLHRLRNLGFSQS
jgi:hypothetical protein